ncbi:MAG: YdcF family protein [Chloroflexales bacterium]|nr:YdcF family protein [Chloroflexales bacterium]
MLAVTEPGKRRKKQQQLYRFCFVIALFVILFALFVTQIGPWLALPAHIQPVDAIVVLGGEHPSRIQHGIDLYKQNLAGELWHTGDVFIPQIKDSYARIASRLATRRGVPQRAIHLLSTTNTWEDGQEIAVLAQARNINSILVVTSWYHSRRALCVIQSHLAGSGVAIYHASPPTATYTPETWWFRGGGWFLVGRELAAMAQYWQRYDVRSWSC